MIYRTRFLTTNLHGGRQALFSIPREMTSEQITSRQDLFFFIIFLMNSMWQSVLFQHYIRILNYVIRIAYDNSYLFYFWPSIISFYIVSCTFYISSFSFHVITFYLFIHSWWQDHQEKKSYKIYPNGISLFLFKYLSITPRHLTYYSMDPHLKPLFIYSQKMTGK